MKATFLTFGFMPTTATMVLEQKGPMRVVADSKTHIFDVTQGEATAVIRISLVIRITDVRVNGTPLDVGPDCRTAGPLYSKDPDPAQDTKDHMVLSGFTFRNPDGSFDGYTLGAERHPARKRHHPAFRGLRCGRGPRPPVHRLGVRARQPAQADAGRGLLLAEPRRQRRLYRGVLPRDIPQAER